MAVSTLHEFLVDLVRKRPQLVPELLSQLLGIAVPPSAKAVIADPTLNQSVAVEFRADAAVVMTVRDAAVLGSIVEVQLSIEKRKRYTWPHYATGARAAHECEFILLVIAPDAEVARWAGEPIDLGFGSVFQPHVLGPEQIPKITDTDEAARDLALAGLSVAAHGKGDPNVAARIAGATYRAATKVANEEHQTLYWYLIRNALSKAAKEIFDMLPDVRKWYDDEALKLFHDAKAEGKAEGQATMLLKILVGRGLAMTEHQQRRISECTDPATLDRWAQRALTAASVDELFR
jgi:hypothetical protein